MCLKWGYNPLPFVLRVSNHTPPVTPCLIVDLASISTYTPDPSMDRIVSGVRWNRVNRHFNVIALTGANLCIINWVVRALNADSLTAVVHYIRPYTRGMTKHLFLPL